MLPDESTLSDEQGITFVSINKCQSYYSEIVVIFSLLYSKTENNITKDFGKTNKITTAFQNVIDVLEHFS